MNPEDVTEDTELERLYISDFCTIKSGEDFELFLKRWETWLEPRVKAMTADDWPEVYDTFLDGKGFSRAVIHSTQLSDKNRKAVEEAIVPPRFFRLYSFARKVGMKSGWAFVMTRTDNTLVI